MTDIKTTDILDMTVDIVIIVIIDMTVDIVIGIGTIDMDVMTGMKDRVMITTDSMDQSIEEDGKLLTHSCLAKSRGGSLYQGSPCLCWHN